MIKVLFGNLELSEKKEEEELLISLLLKILIGLEFLFLEKCLI